MVPVPWKAVAGAWQEERLVHRFGTCLIVIYSQTYVVVGKKSVQGSYPLVLRSALLVPAPKGVHPRSNGRGDGGLSIDNWYMPLLPRASRHRTQKYGMSLINARIPAESTKRDKGKGVVPRSEAGRSRGLLPGLGSCMMRLKDGCHEHDLQGYTSCSTEQCSSLMKFGQTRRRSNCPERGAILRNRTHSPLLFVV
jgi:hypothetical protein